MAPTISQVGVGAVIGGRPLRLDWRLLKAADIPIAITQMSKNQVPKNTRRNRRLRRLLASRPSLSPLATQKR
jgi:hypothetical protein